MRIIEHTVDIQAPPATVWQILTDTDRHVDWNPFLPRLSGRLAPGQRLTLTVRPGTRTMSFRPTVLAVEDGALIRWLGRLGVRGLFDGEHELRLEPIPGGTRFVQRETFTGLLVPMMPRVLDDTATGFAAMNTALRDRAVSRTVAAEGARTAVTRGPPPGGTGDLLPDPAAGEVAVQSCHDLVDRKMGHRRIRSEFGRCATPAGRAAGRYGPSTGRRAREWHPGPRRIR
jgi:hypothetical protein